MPRLGFFFLLFFPFLLVFSLSLSFSFLVRGYALVQGYALSSHLIPVLHSFPPSLLGGVQYLTCRYLQQRLFGGLVLDDSPPTLADRPVRASRCSLLTGLIHTHPSPPTPKHISHSDSNPPARS
ncbi:hypothetical protein LZ30DRAFT_700498 [Colletotrichum cereale]|nr:hypothetical protein LZ30DRAFT_700498 [Colletotrichum cereale]